MGQPLHDDQRLFEMLTLEGAQAGLSWSTILRKRAGYTRAFANFDPRRVARFDARRRAALRRDSGIVRNRLKIDSTVSNARAFLAVQREFGSFDRYLWSFVGGRPRVNRPRGGQLPAHTPLSDAVSRDLSRRGFRFVGSDHHLCLPAGRRGGERSLARLLSLSAGAAGRRRRGGRRGRAQPKVALKRGRLLR